MIKLTNEKLKDFIFGSLYINEVNGYLTFDRLTKEEHDMMTDYTYCGSIVNCSISLEFESEENRFSFDYQKKLFNTEFDTIDYLIDGKLIESYPLRSLYNVGTLSLEIPKGKHHVAIYFPSDGVIDIKNFVVENNINNISKNKKILFIGDSITQGYGPYVTSKSYVNIIKNNTNFDILNQGVGGYFYDDKFLQLLDGWEKPDLIVVAMGINQYKEDDRFDKVINFYKKFDDLYHGIPTICITPLWTSICPEMIDQLIDYCNFISKTVSSYSYISIVNGFDIIPHSNDYFKDGLHPNIEGCKIYGTKLLNIIKSIMF